MNWFFAAGDAPFFFPEQLRQLVPFSQVWHGETGYGISALPFLWIDYPFRLITFFLSRLGLSWFVIDKLWWSFIIGLALYSSYKWARFVGLEKKFSLITSIIYSSNTYFLLLFDGGQLGVALAYSFVPFILELVLSYFQKGKKLLSLKDTVKTGLGLGILTFLDLRIAYVFDFAIVIIGIILLCRKKFSIPKQSILLPFIILGVNFFWILPTLQYKSSLSPIIEKNIGPGLDLPFFSVADFSHSFSLLHPNYPDNLFGRVYFFKPEFLILPILAFSLFLWKDPPLIILLFGLTGLVGSFLGKGVHEPFGVIYELLYKYLPGFFLFRDPTKWYVLTAVSYSFLIPQTLKHLAEKINAKFVIFAFGVVWLFTLRLVFSGQVSGNLGPPHITPDYEQLATLLSRDQNPGRTLWMPSMENFGYASDVHPALSAPSLLNESSPAGIIRLIGQPESFSKIQNASVSYLIVPEDLQKRIFLDDYIYKENLRKQLVSELDYNPRVTKISGFRKLAVYKILRYQPFFSINGNVVPATFDQNQWSISLPQIQKEALLSTSLAYDPNWRLQFSEGLLTPVEKENHFLTFLLPPQNRSEAKLVYLPQRLTAFSAVVSLTFFSTLVIFLLRK